MPHALSRHAPLVLLLCAASLCLQLHLRALGGDFLSDDFVHAAWIASAQANGELGHWLLQRFYLPLDSGNYAYRPVVFASYALDWVAHGGQAAGWHLTNLLVHLLNAALALRLSRRLARLAGSGDARFTALATTALFLAVPFAGETTFWPVGRFDLLACTFSLFFLDALLPGGQRPRCARALLPAVFLLLALLCKESAMPMLAVGFALLLTLGFGHFRAAGPGPAGALRAALRYALIRYWAVLALVAAYFCWRFALFGSPWKVYPDSHFPASAAELASRIGALRHVLTHPYGDAAGAWSLLIALALTAWLAGAGRALKAATFREASLAGVLLGCAIGYLAAPATSFPAASANGEGIRNLYLPWLMFSLFAGLAIARHRRRTGLLCLGLFVAFWGQWRLLGLWQDTAAEMLRVTTAIPELARQVGDERYALLLLPDHVGPVPFVRNAQAAVVTPPRQAADWLSKMAAMTPLQFEEWEQNLADNVIGKLKQDDAAIDRGALLGVYCWRPSQAGFHLLQAMPHAGDPRSWRAETLAEAGRAGCLL